MNWRTTAVLFVILAALAGYLYYDSQQGGEVVVDDEGEALTAVATLPLVNERIPLNEGLTIATVQQLTVSRSSDSVQASFSQDDSGNWAQTSPQAQAVLSTTLTTQLTGYLTLTSNRVFSSADNPLSAYGLETPAYQIDISGGDQRHILYVGNETPPKDGYYVQSLGDPRVYVVAKGTVDNLINLIDTPPLPTP